MGAAAMFQRPDAGPLRRFDVINFVLSQNASLVISTAENENLPAAYINGREMRSAVAHWSRFSNFVETKIIWKSFLKNLAQMSPWIVDVN